MTGPEIRGFQPPPNMLLEMQKLHAVSIARQTDVISRLDKLIAAQQEQNQLLREVVQALNSGK